MSIPSLPKELLAAIRAHPQFPQAVRSIQVPQPPSYRLSEDANQQAYDFAYHSGMKDGYLLALHLFGIVPE